jgi:hypothetical protein
MTRTRPAKQVIGWREWVELPELGVEPMKAKVDTGARTAALHAFRLRLEERDGQQWARFEIHPEQRSRRGTTTVELPVVDVRKVRSSNGDVQLRPMVRTPVVVAGHRFSIDVTLTDRDEMGFRMLLGRASIRRRFIVDPGRSFLGGGRAHGPDEEG